MISSIAVKFHRFVSSHITNSVNCMVLSHAVRAIWKLNGYICSMFTLFWTVINTCATETYRNFHLFFAYVLCPWAKVSNSVSFSIFSKRLRFCWHIYIYSIFLKTSVPACTYQDYPYGKLFWTLWKFAGYRLVVNFDAHITWTKLILHIVHICPEQVH